MKVAFSPAVLEDRRAFRHLSALLWMFVDGRHDWVVEDDEAIGDSAWLRDASAGVRDAAHELAAIALRKTRTPQIVVDVMTRRVELDATDGVWRIRPDVAAEHLGRPLLLIVENGHCDGAFTRLLVTRVGEKRLRRLLGDETFNEVRGGWSASVLGDGRWFDVRHGGGSTTATQLRLAVEQARGLPPRIACFVDSDRAAPGGAIGDTAKAVEVAAAELNADLPTHWSIQPLTLSKREVENYLPGDALRAQFGGGRYAAWARLDDDERDHLNLKQHFAKHAWRVMIEPACQKHLHARNLRERAGNGGRELDTLIERIVSRL